MPAALYEIPIGQTDRITVDWEEWLDELPAGQTLDSVAHAFDGGAGGLVLSNSGTVSKKSIVNLNAGGASVGFYFLKITATSNAAPDNFVAPRWLQIRVVAKKFVEPDD